MNSQKGKQPGLYPLFLLFFICGSGLLQAALGAAPKDKLLEAAMKEGEISWYATQNLKAVQAVATGFESQNPGIKVKVFRANSDEQLIRVLAEYTNKKYIADVIEINIQMMSALKAKQVMGKYVSPESRTLPADWKDPEEYWASHYNLQYVTAFNTKHVPVKDAPKSLEDLLDPKWKGKINADPTKPQWFIAQLDRMGKDKAMAYMKKLGEQQLTARNYSTTIQLLSSGEVVMDLFNPLVRVEEFKRKGAPIEWARISPVIVSTGGIGITSHPPHPNAARLFVDYVLSKKGQTILGENDSIPSVPGTDHPLRDVLAEMELYPVKALTADEFNRLFSLYRTTLRIK